MEDITLTRDSEGVQTNVPHTWVYQSPKGFDWGTDGPGTTDLAINILMKCGLSQDLAHLYHNDFKLEYLINMPKEGGTIKSDVIKQWIESRITTQ